MNHDFNIPETDGPAFTEPAAVEPMCVEAEIVEEGSPWWGPWATVGFTLVFVAACLFTDTIASVIFVVFMMVDTPKIDPVELTAQLKTSGLLLSVATFFRAVCCATLIPLFVIARRRLSVRQYLALTPVRPGVMAFWLGATLIFAVCSDALTHVLDRPIVSQFMLDAWQTSGWPPILWLAVIIGAPLVEETVFRGFLFVGLRQFRHGNTVAVLVTSIVWASIHVQYDLYQIGTIFFIGILLGVARIRSGSLYVPLAMHTLINLLATVEAGIKIYAVG